jgi:hypothetical protein
MKNLTESKGHDHSFFNVYFITPKFALLTTFLFYCRLKKIKMVFFFFFFFKEINMVCIFMWDLFIYFLINWKSCAKINGGDCFCT